MLKPCGAFSTVEALLWNISRKLEHETMLFSVEHNLKALRPIRRNRYHINLNHSVRDKITALIY